MKYLLTTTEVYRVESENEAKKMIEEAKEDNHFILKKYTSEYKERRQKGEVIDTYWKVSLIKTFTDEKDPQLRTVVSYASDVDSAF